MICARYVLTAIVATRFDVPELTFAQFNCQHYNGRVFVASYRKATINDIQDLSFVQRALRHGFSLQKLSTSPAVNALFAGLWLLLHCLMHREQASTNQKLLVVSPPAFELA